MSGRRTSVRKGRGSVGRSGESDDQGRPPPEPQSPSRPYVACTLQQRWNAWLSSCPKGHHRLREFACRAPACIPLALLALSTRSRQASSPRARSTCFVEFAVLLRTWHETRVADLEASSRAASWYAVSERGRNSSFVSHEAVLTDNPQLALDHLDGTAGHRTHIIEHMTGSRSRAHSQPRKDRVSTAKHHPRRPCRLCIQPIA
jgi:hypothetical protein